MAIYKCKMCGGDIHPQEDTRLITCEYCGTTQTVCLIDDSRIVNLFNRANEQRLNNEFDKAEALYETILVENPQESEAYWGKCLCKYGIEYVDDTSTGKKVPTCHRTIYESIFDDRDYERALINADPVAEKQYHQEAKEIDNIQKRILEVASKEDPYDVFICYKETDEKGERTPDSVHAQKLYDALTEKGLKVFFSRITLENKLGVDYEPYIFSALQSSKVMLVVSTKYDYINSVWVKNEWKRFIKLSEDNNEKTLVPCYADMDPSDLPKEFKMLQGQDLTKIGAEQDVVRGVIKILEKTETTNVPADSLKKYVDQSNKKLVKGMIIGFIASLIVIAGSLFGIKKIRDIKSLKSYQEEVKNTVIEKYIGIWNSDLETNEKEDRESTIIINEDTTIEIDGEMYYWSIPCDEIGSCSALYLMVTSQKCDSVVENLDDYDSEELKYIIVDFNNIVSRDHGIYILIPIDEVNDVEKLVFKGDRYSIEGDWASDYVGYQYKND